jgi:hypothetical protein
VTKRATIALKQDETTNGLNHPYEDEEKRMVLVCNNLNTFLYFLTNL